MNDNVPAAQLRVARFLDTAPARERLAEHLKTTTEERLAVSNPRILKSSKP